MSFRENRKSIYIYIILCILCGFITSIIIYLYSNLWLKIRICIISIFDLIYLYIFFFLKKTTVIKRIIVSLTIINIMAIPIISIINEYSFRNSTNYGWKKISKFPVLGNLKTGSFFDPYVVKVDNEFYIYFSDRKNWCIALSKSSDGINWSSPIPVLRSSVNNNWEKVINRASILYNDGKFLMWYTGQSGGKSSIWYAESNDGINFKKNDKNPILVPDLDFEWESIMNPDVIYDDSSNLYKMYYAAGEQYEPDCIGYAESNDGIHREKRNTPILEKSENFDSYDYFKVWATDVHIMDNGMYVMFYIWYTDINTARIMFAMSDDGISWRRDKNYLIQSTKFWFDGDAVYKPSVYFDEWENKWMMRYNWRLSNREYIGYAECIKCLFNEVLLQ